MLDIYFESPLITCQNALTTLTWQNSSLVEEMGGGGRLFK